MPRFKSREEYEKWRAEKMGISEEKPSEPPKKPQGPPEKPLRFEEAPSVPEKKVQRPHETSLQLEEIPLEPRKKPTEAQEISLESQKTSPKTKDEPWNLQKSFLDFRGTPDQVRGRLPEPEHKSLELDTGGELGEIPLPRSGDRPRRRRANLRSTGELLRDSWDIFKTRFLVLVGLYLFPFFLMLGVLGIFVVVSLLSRSFLAVDIKVAVIGGVLIGMIPALVAMSWGMAGFTCAVVDEKMGFTDALSRGWSRLWAFAWVWSLAGFIVTGAFFLLIVPGILLGIWFFFAPFVLASEDERGMNALLKSKEYVKGQWFAVFGRLAATWFISFGIGLIPVVGPLAGTIFAPFFMVFGKLVYDDLKAMKGESVAYPRSGGEKFKWLGLGTIGYVIFPVIIIALMGSCLTIPLLMLIKGNR
jgi:hypothetical protein